MKPKKLLKKLIKSPFHFLGYDIVRMPREEAKKPIVKKPLLLKNNYAQLVLFMYLKKVYDLIATVEGDVVECGVGEGQSFFMLCFLAHLENRGRLIYGLDSFEGFPEPSEEDKSPRNPQKGEWNVSTIELIEQLLEEGGFETSFIKSNVRLIKGFFDESVYKYDGKSIAFLHLDCDLNQSYKVTLEYFWPKVAKGGIVLFDEYKTPQILLGFPGASKAIDEFLGDSIQKIQFDERAQRYYIVKQ